jgi:hypothetical protein
MPIPRIPRPLPVLIAGTLAIATPALAADPLGKLLFFSPGTTIVGADGATRTPQRGAVILPGDRVVTPDGALAQVKLPDGSFIGVRPGSDVKFDVQRDGAPQLDLKAGTVRVINLELPDRPKPMPIELVAGDASITLKGADLESGVRDGAGLRRDVFTRLNAGIGTLSNGKETRDIALREVKQITRDGIVDAPIESLPPIAVRAGPRGGFEPDSRSFDPKPPTDPVRGGEVVGKGSIPVFERGAPVDLPPRKDVDFVAGLPPRNDAFDLPGRRFVELPVQTGPVDRQPGRGSELLPPVPTTLLINPDFAGNPKEVAAAIINPGSVGVIRTEDFRDLAGRNFAFTPPPPPPGGPIVPPPDLTIDPGKGTDLRIITRDLPGLRDGGFTFIRR